MIGLVVASIWLATTPPPAPEPPNEPVTNGPITAVLVESYYSQAASQLVVIIEMTAAETSSPRGSRAVYVGSDGQQVEAVDAIEPDDVFPGATALVVMQFPAAAAGGQVIFEPTTTEEFNDYEIIIPIPTT